MDNEIVIDDATIRLRIKHQGEDIIIEDSAVELHFAFQEMLRTASGKEDPWNSFAGMLSDRWSDQLGAYRISSALAATQILPAVRSRVEDLKKNQQP